jgi:hypothetical protein
MIMDEVFNEHFVIKNDTFKVVLSILKGYKLDAGMLAYQTLEIHKLGDANKYLYIKQPTGFDGSVRFSLDDNQPAITWSDGVNRELFNAINNVAIPHRYLIDPHHFSGII